MPKPNKTNTPPAPPPLPPVPTLPPMPVAAAPAQTAAVDMPPLPSAPTPVEPVLPSDAPSDAATAKKKTARRPAGPPLDLREFVRVWQTSDTVDEVVARMGYSKGYLQHRATDLRKGDPANGRKPVPLKSMKSGGGRVAASIDADELNDILASLQTEAQTSAPQ